MDTTRLSEGRDELLRHMERVGYSTPYIAKVRCEIDWLCASHDSFDTYEEALDLRAPKGRNRRTRGWHGTIIGICKHFDLDGELPEHGRRHPLVEPGAYHRVQGFIFGNLMSYIVSENGVRGPIACFLALVGIGRRCRLGPWPTVTLGGRRGTRR